MTIRTYRPDDEAAQVAVYNEAAAALPKFKPATAEEHARRVQAGGFDPATRVYAEEGGRVVGYAVFHPNGRVSYPWCLPGHEAHAGPLFEAALAGLRARGVRRAFAAYRGDWPAVCEFFTKHGFRPAREMVNFVVDFVDMPTPAARPNVPLSPVQPADLPEILEMGRGVLRVSTLPELEQELLHNASYPADSLYCLRPRPGSPPTAVAILVVNPQYADPKQIDPNMPCFRLGAFGTEGTQTKRVNGLFSFLTRGDRDVHLAGLDLMGQAAQRLQDTDLGTFAAQVPSDAAHLLRFYQRHFRRQGGFPVFEYDL